MKTLIAATAIALAFVLPAAAQTTAPSPRVKPAPPEDPVVKRCREQHGVDCDTPEGLREWRMLERPMTEEQRRAAAAARLKREQRQTK